MGLNSAALWIAVGINCYFLTVCISNNYRVEPSKSKLKEFSKAAVVTDAAICAPIGKEILQKGGHAVDSAIATLLCNGVVNMHSLGLGGGGLMIIYDKSNKKIDTLNFRERAPQQSFRNMFAGIKNITGGISIATPGEIPGYLAAHEKYGKLEWKDLFKPTIDLLRAGVPICEALAKKFDEHEYVLMRTPGLRKMFYNEKSSTWKTEGDLYKNEKLALTLERIANNKNYYKNDLAAVMEKEIKCKNGYVTKEDITANQPKWKDSISSEMTNRGIILHTMSAPGGGALPIFIANILNGYNFSKKTFDTLESAALFIHRSVEAIKFAFRERKSLLGDEEVTQGMKERISEIIQPSYADKIRLKIWDNTTHPIEYYGVKYEQIKDEGTSHTNVIDADGNAVAVTSSINSVFGSRVLGEDTGILYNNKLIDFNLPDAWKREGLLTSLNNYIAPNKQPMSSMSPIIGLDTDGNVVLCVGASGAARIISTVGSVISRILFLNETIKEAIDYPHFHHYLKENFIKTEETFSKPIIHELKKRGHKFQDKPMELVVVQALYVDRNGKIYANADFRKKGDSDGF